MVTKGNEGSHRAHVIVKRRSARSVFFAVGTLLMLALFALSSGIAWAQEDDAPAAVKTRKIGIHSSGTITIDGTACPNGTPIGDDCYATSGTLKQGKETGAVSGTIITSGTPTTTKSKGTCYTLINTSTLEVVVEGYTLTGSLIGEACIKTTKKGVSTEQLIGGAWETTIGSPVSGKGKRRLKERRRTLRHPPALWLGVVSLTSMERWRCSFD